MKVVVFGLGYVGAVSAACLASVGHEVVGVDVDLGKVATINDGRSPILEAGLEDLIAAGVSSGRLRATSDCVPELDDADVSVVCVGTPSSPSGGLTTHHVEAVCKEIGRAIADRAPGHVIAIRSTVLPGTVDTVVVPAIEAASGAAAGGHFAVAMCPEFLRESTSIEDFFDPPFTVIGAEHELAITTMRRLFAFVEPTVVEMDIRSAEALKYSCNAFHAIKVAFANEMGRFCSRNGADGRAVMDVFCSDDRLNLSRYYLRPGFAFGGSCLPKDLRAIVHQARHHDLDLPLVQSVLPSNAQHLAAAIDRILAMEVREVALLGLSFKGGTDDLRESPSVELAETLIGKGLNLRIFDPSVDPETLLGSNLNFVAERLPHLGELLRVDAADAINEAECVVVASTELVIQEALIAERPSRLLDLTGQLRPEIEALPGFEGLAW